MNNCYYHLLSYELRFYTRISSLEKSRNHAREKIRSLFTCVWYRQSAADASILNTWLFVGIFSDYGCYVWKLRGYLDISLLSNRVEHSQRNSIATRANVLFSICHSLSVILYLSFSICHSLSVILITVKPFHSVFWWSLYYSCVKLWHLYILKIWPLRHFVWVITSRDSVPRIMFEGHRRRLVFQHLLFEDDTRDWLFSRRYIL